MEEVVARIHLREEAAVKRERAMAYAFSHQVLQHSNTISSIYCLMVVLKGLRYSIYIDSGGPTQRTLYWVIMNLEKLSGVGAGWNVGLLLDHGKVEP